MRSYFGIVLYFYIKHCFCETELSLVDQILQNQNDTPSMGNESARGKNNSIDFTFTKQLNIRLEDRYGSLLRPDVQEVLRSQLTAESEAQNYRSSQNGVVATEILDKMKKEFDAVKDLLQTHNSYELSLEKYVEGFINGEQTYARNAVYGSVCRSLVGVDKLPICRSLEKENGSQEQVSKNVLPRNCKEIQRNGTTASGLYEIQPRMSKKPFMVLCDMETKGGGWTHIQKRVDGSEDFYRGWRDYKHGFGNLDGEFWIGLENIYALTGFEVNELLIEIVDRDMFSAFAHYKTFGIGPEKEGYPLSVLKDFFGDAGDSLTDHLGSKFTTKDFDQDQNPSNCAVLFDGAWWYKSCHISNLNGKYLNVDLPAQYKFHGLHWKTFRSHEYCHAKARMLVRPVQT